MGYRNIVLLVCAGTIMGLQHASYQELPGSKWINQYIYIYISFLPHQNGCHFNTFSHHLPFLVETLEVLFGWSNHPGEKSRHKPKPAPTKEHKSKPPLPWPRHKQKTLQRPTVDTFKGTQKGPGSKKKHTNWMRHPKWFTLDLKMPKQVGMLQYYLWDDDALPTSFDSPTCLEPSSHWATHSFEIGHCHCWSKFKRRSYKHQYPVAARCNPLNKTSPRTQEPAEPKKSLWNIQTHNSK